jgi:hypothetical protein
MRWLLLHRSNKLTDLVDELEELRYLRLLRVKYNQLRRLPPVVTRLAQLAVLELSGNAIQRLDDSIASLLWLRELDLSGNQLVELPPGICTLPRLEARKPLLVACSVCVCSASWTRWLLGGKACAQPCAQLHLVACPLACVFGVQGSLAKCQHSAFENHPKWE